MSTVERVRQLVEPIVAASPAELYDLELSGGVLRVLVDEPGGVGMDRITELTRAISRALDDADPIASRFTLEVSSPGLERPLRRPDHYRGAVGTAVAVKTVAGTPGDRRVHGLLESADDEGFVVRVDEPSASDDGSEPPTTRRLSYDEVERARTVFEWGPPAKPAGANRRTKRSKGAAARRPAAEQKQQKKVIAS